MYNSTVCEYFSVEYSGPPFVLFGTQHLVALGILVTVCVLITLFRHRFSPSARKIFRYSLAVLVYANESSWHIWKLANNDWNLQVMLPLWLCSLTAWTMPLLLIWKQRWYFEWVYLLGTIGAMMALLQPDLTIYGFPHFRFIEFITLHGALVVGVVYFVAVEGFRPHIKSFPYVLLFTNLYWLLCAWVNSLIGSNYLYTHSKLPTPSLLDLLGPHPVYLIWMEIIGIGLCLLLYLPFYIPRRKVNSPPSVA
jgi:hypothetical integral membrane protein (TIGR02206 family)